MNDERERAREGVPPYIASYRLAQTGEAHVNVHSGGLRSLWRLIVPWTPIKVVFAWTRTRLFGRDSSVLLRLIASSAILSLLLAPLTSWSIDTPSFVSAVLSLIYNGSPYAGHVFFNPPLGPYLQAPLFAMLVQWVAPQSLLVTVGTISPGAIATGASSEIPTAAALLALKVPLILAFLLSSLCVRYLAEGIVGVARANRVVAAWALNPLVIWATAVHGELDILSATFVLLFLVATVRRWYFLAGLSLALGILSKAYPLAILPAALVGVCVVEITPGFRTQLPRIVAFLIGVGSGLAPFIPYASTFISMYGGAYPATDYGGFNIGLIANRTIFLPSNGVLNSWLTAPNGEFLEGALRTLFYISIPGSVALVLLLRRAALSSNTNPASSLARPMLFAYAWPLAGILMFQPSPQSENLITLLAILLLLGAVGVAEGKQASRVLFWLLSSAGWMLYLALATPLAFFYPLAAYLGPGAIAGVNYALVAYSRNTMIPRIMLWSIAGLAGGSVILCVWVLSLVTTLRICRPGLRAVQGSSDACGR